MLGKLFKYELKATARLFIPLYLTILAFAVVNLFFLPTYNIGEKSSALHGIAMSISMIIYVTLMIGMLLMTLIVMIQRFYKNLLGDEGYLMFTLPVQPWKHIFSKLAVSMLWTVVSGIVAFCSILIISSKNISATEIYKGLEAAFNQFVQYFGASSFLVSLEAIVLGLLFLASSILTIYAAISLGHLFNKHKLLISFGMYIVLKTISQMLMTLFAFISGHQGIFGVESGFIPSALQANIFLLIFISYFGVITTGYYLLTNYILKRRLNLE